MSTETEAELIAATISLLDISRLHQQVPEYDGTYFVCDECSQEYPCRTIAILDQHGVPITYDPSEPM